MTPFQHSVQALLHHHLINNNATTPETGCNVRTMVKTIKNELNKGRSRRPSSEVEEALNLIVGDDRGPVQRRNNRIWIDFENHQREFETWTKQVWQTEFANATPSEAVKRHGNRIIELADVIFTDFLNWDDVNSKSVRSMYFDHLITILNQLETQAIKRRLFRSHLLDEAEAIVEETNDRIRNSGSFLLLYMSRIQSSKATNPPRITN